MSHKQVYCLGLDQIYVIRHFTIDHETLYKYHVPVYITDHINDDIMHDNIK